MSIDDRLPGLNEPKSPLSGAVMSEATMNEATPTKHEVDYYPAKVN